MRLQFLIIFLLIVSSLIMEAAPVGTVLLVQGEGSVIRNQRPVALSPGDLINDQEVIQTGKQSSLEIQLNGNKGILRIEADSKLHIKSIQFKQKQNFSMSFFYGKVKCQISKESDEHFRVTTPSVTCGVRGTTFTVQSNLAGDSAVVVEEGEVIAGTLDYKQDDSSRETEMNLNQIVNEAHVKNGQTRKSRIIDLEKHQIDGKDLSEDSLQIKMDQPEINEQKIAALKTKLKYLGRYFKKIGKALKRIDSLNKKINQYFKRIDKMLKTRFKKVEKYLKADFVKDLEDNVSKSLYEVNLKTINELNHLSVGILDYSRILLDDYWATREMMFELVDRYDSKEIEVDESIEDYKSFRVMVINLKRSDKSAYRMEDNWKGRYEKIVQLMERME